jgi:CheY-like chemotaxis protein
MAGVADSLPLGSMLLVVDDDPPLRDLWRAILSRGPGVCVIDAEDGFEALQMARQLQPDLILMDLTMPGVDGLETTRRLKADPKTARIPVVAVTGQVYDAQHVLDAGCDGYLLKPVAPKALVDQVTRLLARRRLRA